MKECIDGLLDLRNYCDKDRECYSHPDAKMALTDVINKIDTLLKEMKK